MSAWMLGGTLSAEGGGASLEKRLGMQEYGVDPGRRDAMEPARAALAGGQALTSPAGRG
jgi:hypothetical protein